MTPKVQAALLGGLVMGVLSALPLVGSLNFCCCLWVIAGGMLTAYLLQANQPNAITPGEGAGVGLFAGLVGAFVELFISIPVALLFGPVEDRILQGVFGSLGQDAPFLPGTLSPSGRLARLAISFPIILITRAIFATLGGLIGAVLFQRQRTAPPPPPGTVEILPPE